MPWLTAHPTCLAMRDDMLAKADFVMLKLSPMLDWHKTVADFGSCVGEVHIVSAGNECKELLLVMSARFDGLTSVTCVNDGSIFSYNPQTDIQKISRMKTARAMTPAATAAARR